MAKNKRTEAEISTRTRSDAYYRSFESWLEEAKERHGDKFIYDRVKFNSFNDYVWIKCPIHDYFLQNVRDHLKSGCFECGKLITSKKLMKSQEQAIKEFKEVHGDKFGYDNFIYQGSGVKSWITCSKHGNFLQKPNEHLQGYGCRKCANEYKASLFKISTEQFIEKAIKVHGNDYFYDKVEYINTGTYVLIGCKKHKYFKQTPASHLRGAGCPSCSHFISDVEIEWLDKIEKERGIILVRQYRIPKTRYIADGFYPETNEIFEMNGDFFHGNLEIYNYNDYNPKCKKTFGELHEGLLIKEVKIKELGYNLISIWESEFEKLKKECKNK